MRDSPGTRQPVESRWAEVGIKQIPALALTVVLALSCTAPAMPDAPKPPPPTQPPDQPSDQTSVQPTPAKRTSVQPTPTQRPAAPETAPPPAAVGATRVGERLFMDRGCAACHGPQAGGTEAAPPIAGKTQFATREQVRNPHRRMPRFTLDQLSDADLRLIADYITGLVAPSIEIISPADGSWVPAGRVEVRVKIEYLHRSSGMPLPVGRNGIQHIIYYYKDVEIPVPRDRPPLSAPGTVQVAPEITAYWQDVGPGTHTFGAQLVDMERIPLSPPVMDRVTVAVRTP